MHYHISRGYLMKDASKIFFSPHQWKKLEGLKKQNKTEYFGLVRESTSLSGVLFDNDSKCTTCIPMHAVITIMLMAAFFFWKLEKQLMKRGLFKKITVSKIMEYKYNSSAAKKKWRCSNQSWPGGSQKDCDKISNW